MSALKNGTIAALTVAAANLLLGVAAAYSFSRLKFRRAGALYTFVLASRLLPLMALAIPPYLIVSRLGPLDRYGALISIHSAVTLPFTGGF